MTTDADMLVLVFYVPEKNAEEVKQAVFKAGAGKIGNYDSCAWQTLGSGQFRPLAGANPAIGDVDKTESLPELRVELVCAKNLRDDVEKALLTAHSFETPAYLFLNTL